MYCFRSARIVCIIALGVSTALAQTGAIQGVLTDAAGATVPNAKITAFDQDKGVIARERTSSSAGDFHLTPLLPGHYTVRVEAHGIQNFREQRT